MVRPGAVVNVILIIFIMTNLIFLHLHGGGGWSNQTTSRWNTTRSL